MTRVTTVWRYGNLIIIVIIVIVIIIIINLTFFPQELSSNSWIRWLGGYLYYVWVAAARRK